MKATRRFARRQESWFRRDPRVRWLDASPAADAVAAEVRNLAARGLRDGKTASRALGYQQLLRYLDGEWTLDEARLETMKATRRFARRQESWFRRDPRVRWLDASPAADAVAAEALRLVRPA
jgi:tRNA dimethylallyltransferase